MEVLIYKDIEYYGLKKQVDKVLASLQNGDFKSADVKKMPNTGYFRAKLDDKNRLLFKVGSFGGQKHLFILEVIANHAYDKSRFLAGAVVDEAKLLPIASLAAVSAEDAPAVPFLNRRVRHFHILDKIISFDDIQEEVFRLQPPLIVVGSAGSGKTALTLEKIKDLTGRVLYVTLSPFLVESARNLYYSYNYDNDRQETDFLSFREYLSTISVPKGRELQYRDFEQWIWRYRQAYRVRDAHKVFEEFKGVITGSVIDKPYLSREEYLRLGVRQSVFTPEERADLYDLFLKYLEFLQEGLFYDTNLASFERLSKVRASYDYVVVDEVQDITNVQLALLLRGLKNPAHFFLCGDSNQIVHPNFFSWSNVKTMFYHQDLRGELIRVLATNYRNTPEVTQIANQLLKVKNARFGSIDRESTYIVLPNSTRQGVVEFFEDKNDIKTDFNKKTGKSTRFAILVMRNEDKAEARKFFNTPLLFSVQEAKGLEYENIILFNIISGNDKEFRELCSGVSKADLEADLEYARARDKSDKSLEIYKFYVNSLYVAITRAVSNLYIIERNKKHELLELLGLTNFRQKLDLKDQNSSLDDWQKEARKLELQGKQEQADEIRRNILHTQAVPWEVITPDKMPALRAAALNPEIFNKKAKDRLFEYAVFYHELSVIPELAKLNYRRADLWQKERVEIMRRLLADYQIDKPSNIKGNLQKYGVNFRNEYNLTPLMLASSAGAINIIRLLKEEGADLSAMDNLGRNAFQLSLARAQTEPLFLQKTFFQLYQMLLPATLTVKVGDRLFKLHNRQMEFFLLNYMIALTRHLFTVKALKHIPGFDVDDVISFTKHFPSHLMPDYRKQRTYTSANLSGNEHFRLSGNSKQLFFRIERGHYILNPLLEIGVGEEWFGFYDTFVRLEELGTMGGHNVQILKAALPRYKQRALDFLKKPATDAPEQPDTPEQPDEEQ